MPFEFTQLLLQRKKTNKRIISTGSTHVTFNSLVRSHHFCFEHQNNTHSFDGQLESLERKIIYASLKLSLNLKIKKIFKTCLYAIAMLIILFILLTWPCSNTYLKEHQLKYIERALLGFRIKVLQLIRQALDGVKFCLASWDIIFFWPV